MRLTDSVRWQPGDAVALRGVWRGIIWWAQAIRAEGERVIALARTGGSPFGDGWERWSPSAGWDMPVLPAGWDRIGTGRRHT